MHESAARLYLAAKELRAVEGQTPVAALIGAETPQTLNNWEVRGVSKEGALLAQAALGCDALWILYGRGTMTAGWPFKRVPLGRWLALLEPAQSYVEGRLLSAIEEVEPLPPETNDEKRDRLSHQAALDVSRSGMDIPLRRSTDRRNTSRK